MSRERAVSESSDGPQEGFIATWRQLGPWPATLLCLWLVSVPAGLGLRAEWEWIGRGVSALGGACFAFAVAAVMGHAGTRPQLARTVVIAMRVFGALLLCLAAVAFGTEIFN